MFKKSTNILIALSIGVIPVSADITPDNCYDFLESGEANYNIAVSTGNIDWGVDYAELKREIETLETKLASDSRDNKSLIELIELYIRVGRGEEARKLAEEKLDIFEEDYISRGDEASAVSFAKAAIAAENGDLYDSAYLGLQPFLESGLGDKESYETAISLRIAANDYDLTTRIADAYIAVYPEEASAHYQKFSAVSARNIYGVVGYWLQNSLEAFLSGRGETAINESNVRPFIEDYIGKISGAFEMQSLERAAELDPDNYEYNLAAAIFKTLIVYYSAIGSLSASEGLDEMDLLDMFRTVDPEGLTNILPYLEKAESFRPETDIQVYLAYALYYMSFGEFNRAQEYATLAVETRPDLPETYDALIIVTVLPIATEMQEDPGIAADVFPDLLDEKIANTGGSAYDYAVLAAVEFFRYGDADNADKAGILTQMKTYTDTALGMDINNPTALLNLGNYYVLKGEYGMAVSVYTEAYSTADPDKKPLFLNNRGIAKVLNNDRDSGIADLKNALDLSDGNGRTTDALAALGVE